MTRPAVIGLVCLVTICAPLWGQAPEAEAPDVATELAELNRTMRELRDLLVRQLETQSLDLMLKRAELASTEVSQLESRLRSAEASQASLEDERRRLTTRMEGFREQDVENPEIRLMERQFAQELEILDERLRDGQARIADLSARLARKQEDLRAWQMTLDRRLSGQ